MITPVRPDPPGGAASAGRAAPPARAARSAQQAQEPAGPRPPRPLAIKIAAIAMCAGAAASVIGTVIYTLTIQHLTMAQLRKSFPAPKYTVAQIHAYQHSAITFSWVFSGILLTLIWLAVAYFTWRGLSMIRIFATALFAMSTWSTVSAVFASSGGFPIVTFVTWVIGLIATVPLWLPISNNYLRYGRAAR